MSITTIQDVKDLYVGDFEDLQTTDEQIQKFIDRLEGQAAYKIPNFLDEVAAGNPPEDIVSGVVASAILEYLISSQTMYQSESQSNGEYSRSVTSNDRFRRKLVLSADDLEILKGDYSVANGEAYMINMGSKRRKHKPWETPWYPLNDYRKYWDGDRGRLL